MITFLLVFPQLSAGQSAAPVVFETNRSVATQLATAAEQMKAGRTSEALQFLEQIANEHGDDLMAADQSETHFLRVRTMIDLFRLRLPPPALAEYRRKVDRQANQWLSQSAADPALLRRIVRRAPAATVAETALNRLGEAAWHRGELGLAYEYWRRLIAANDPERPLDPLARTVQTPAVQVMANLLLCRLAMQHSTMARRELNTLRSAGIDGRVHFGGRSGPLLERLTEELKSPRWQPQYAHFSRPFTRWTRPRNRVTIDQQTSAEQSPLFSVPAVKPGSAIVGDAVFVTDPDTVQVFDLRTGRNPWDDSAEPTILSLPSQQSQLPVTGSVDGIPTSNDSRLIVRMGSPVTVPSPREPQQLSNQLVCLDVGRSQGKVLWSLNPPADAGNGVFESAPVARGPLGFALVRRSDVTVSLSLVCVRLATGEVEWTAPVCAGLDQASGNVNRITNLRVVVGPQYVFVPTDNGAVFAFDDSGRCEWVRTYPRVRRRGAWSGDAICRDGMLYVAARDSDMLMAFRAATGQLVWQRRLPDTIRYLVGIRRGRLIVAGRGPWALSAARGHVLWGGPRATPESFGFGRPMLVGDSLLFPRRDRIEVRRVVDGQSVMAPLRGRADNLAGETNHVIVTHADSVRLISVPPRRP